MLVAFERETRVSGYDYSDVLDDNGREQGGGGLRKQLEEVLAMNKKLVDELTTERRGTSVNSLLKEKGIDPAVAQLVPEGTDPKEWLEKFGHLFLAGGTKMDQEELPTPEVNSLANDELQAERELLEGINGVQDTGSPSTITLDSVEKLKSFTNEDDLMKFINSGGTGG